jgi:hypothetical protein
MLAERIEMFDALPEQELWRAVVISALRDAMEFDLKSINWLFFDDLDAPRVFEYAGMNIDYVRPRLKAVVILMAWTIARNSQPKFDSQKRKIKWIKPALSRRNRAKEFLQSQYYLKLRVDAEIPASESERKALLSSAFWVAKRGRDDEE